MSKLHDICQRSGIKPDALVSVAEALGVSQVGPWLAGGSLRRLLLQDDPFGSDLDFFFRDDGQADAFAERLRKLGFRKVFSTAHATTWKGCIDGRELVVQAVRIGFYASPGDLIDAFDFTICQLAWDGSALTIGEHTLWDLGRKRLVIHKVSYAVATVRRILKYTKQGFTICSGSITRLLKDVADDPSVIRKEVEYVD